MTAAPRKPYTAPTLTELTPSASPASQSLAGTSLEKLHDAPKSNAATPDQVARVDAPGDITATELFAVLRDALTRCGLWAEQANKAQLLGLIATCVSVMRTRGWTVLPPGHHRPVEPR